MYLGGVDLPLDDVEYGDVAVLVRPRHIPLDARAHHHVLGLQQPPHHVQDCRLPHVGEVLEQSRRAGDDESRRAAATQGISVQNDGTWSEVRGVNPVMRK